MAVRIIFKDYASNCSQKKCLQYDHIYLIVRSSWVLYIIFFLLIVVMVPFGYIYGYFVLLSVQRFCGKSVSSSFHENKHIYIGTKRYLSKLLWL